MKGNQTIQNLFGSLVEQFRGDWTSTKEGQQDKLETFNDFQQRAKWNSSKAQSLGFFTIGKLPTEISLSHLKGFLDAYFSSPGIFLDDQGVDSVPRAAWRSILCYVRQANANLILEHNLKPLKTPNAGKCWGIVAITHEDLFCNSDDDLDYVYGASLEGEPGLPGIAVVSTRRVWQPDAVGLELSRLRLLKLLAHEIGHLYFLTHCLTHACVMNGVETLDQIDRHPLGVCPDCMMKLCWTSRTRPKDRYSRLRKICANLKLKTEVNQYTQCVARL
jgi:archaemetzincin